MAKAAEKLIILGDVASGLLSRIHNILDYKRPSCLDQELDAYCKKLGKSFPDISDATYKKVTGEVVFVKRATEIREALADYYKTFVDVLNFKDEAWKLLGELSNTIVSFKFSLNVDLMTYFLNLLTRYVNLHLLVNRVKERKLYLGAYARAYTITNGNSEPTFHTLTSFLAKYEKEDLKTLATDCDAISRRVGETLMTFVDAVKKWSDVKVLADERTFNVNTEAKTMCSPIGQRNHNEIVTVVKMKYWVLMGFLVCPGELQKQGAIELLAKCLQDTMVLNIFRDQQINIHEEYEKLFGWFKQGKFKLSKFKKAIRPNWDQMMFAHHQLRVYLRVEMDTMVHFFTEFPGTLAPKIQMVYAALHLARDELLWYFRHHQWTPPSKKIVLKSDPRITDLIYLTFQLDDLVQKHKRSIQTYYLEYLSNHDLKAVQPVVSKFLTEAKTSQGIGKLLEFIIAGVQNKTIDDNFEALRLNWYRVSAAINHQQSGVSSQLTEQLSRAMEKLIVHSRNVDCVDTQLRTHGSFKALYWHHEFLAQLLKECLQGQANGRNALSLVKVLSHALDNVHRFCPEEQAEIGKHTATLADSWLKTIVSGVEKYLQNVTTQIALWRAQTGPKGVLARINKDHTAAGPLPGYESNNPNNKDVAMLKQWKKSLASICASIQETEAITVYNIEFIPREYLIETLQKTLRSSLRQCCVVDGKHIQRPSVALDKFKDMIYAYQNVEYYVSLNLSSIIRDVLLSEFTDLKCGGAGTLYQDVKVPTSDEKTEELAQTMIQFYCQWFKGFFQKNVAEMGIVYSGVRLCFVAFPVSVGGEQKVVIEAESKTDLNELKALCSMIGPYGVRAIDKEMLDIIKTNTTAIKDVLVKTKAVLEGLKNRFTERETWLASRKKILDADLDAVIDRSIVIGCALKFRDCLRRALRHTTQETVPYIYRTIKLMFRHTHDLLKSTPGDLASLDLLAADAGIDVGESDHSLKATLKELKSQATDPALWALLPELYGLAMSAPKWKSTKYNIQCEGYMNNAHTMAACIRHLIATFNGLGTSGVEGGAAVDARIQADLERFVHSAAYSLLHYSLSVKAPSLIHESMMFLEGFILASGKRVQLSILEDCFPFTLLRTNFIRVYEQQTAMGKRYALATDDEKEAT